MRKDRTHSLTEIDEFRALGHQAVDRISDFLQSLPDRPVTGRISLEHVEAALTDRALPERGVSGADILDRAIELLTEHSVFVNHPRFWAYVLGAGSPISALGDLLAGAFNPPVSSRVTGPMSSAIEVQTVAWLAQLLGLPDSFGGLFLSGGSMSTVTAMSAAIHARAGWDVRKHGVTPGADRLRIYTTSQTHVCVGAAAVLLGLGEHALVQVPTDHQRRMCPDQLRARVRADIEQGLRPLMVVGTAGTTSTGAVDPLVELAALCTELDLWFHVDGAYGGVAVALSCDAEAAGLHRADSIVLDPHKWLYVPLEASCLLVRDPRLLHDAFYITSSYAAPAQPDSSVRSSDATDDVKLLPLRNLGPQTSRGFRALKVWMALQYHGRAGLQQLVTEDIELARHLYELASAHPALQAHTHNLSITTLRFVPPDLAARRGRQQHYLNELNRALLQQLQANGAAYPSHDTLDGAFVIRVCIVNHNTIRRDIEALPEIIVDIGARLHEQMWKQPR